MKEYAIITAAIVIIFTIIGYLNSADVETCMENGNSYSVCDRTFNR